MQAASHRQSNRPLSMMLFLSICLALPSPSQALVPAALDGRGSAYAFNSQDNLCGLTEARQLSRPAQVDYDSLLRATPEVQRMRKQQIAPSSAQGTRLLELARARIQRACRTEMDSSAHCSIWKRITRRDGSNITDLTGAVQARIALSLTP